MICEIENLNTPCYIISRERFESNIRLFENKFSEHMEGRVPLLGYSVKTNHAPELMKYALLYGMAAEVVSDDEYQHALNCGFQADNIIFNGPQKSEKMLVFALQNGSIVNLDNFDEIDIIKSNISKLEVNSLKIGIRVNFDLEEKCPGETTAGSEVSRFGFCVENGDFEKAVDVLHKMGISVKGVHMHYSSTSRSTRIYKELSIMAGKLIEKYFMNTKDFFVDIGGGFFLGEQEHMPGKPTMDDYAKAISIELRNYISFDNIRIILEPGASVIATSVTYLTKVINERTVRKSKVLTVDGSILHINPFMTKREPLAQFIYGEERQDRLEEQVVCGSTCMENDRFLKIRDGVELKKGDYLLCKLAGAYTMGFNSCFINLAPYVYIRENQQYYMSRGKELDLMAKI